MAAAVWEVAKAAEPRGVDRGVDPTPRLTLPPPLTRLSTRETTQRLLFPLQWLAWITPAHGVYSRALSCKGSANGSCRFIHHKLPLLKSC